MLQKLSWPKEMLQMTFLVISSLVVDYICKVFKCSFTMILRFVDFYLGPLIYKNLAKWIVGVCHLYKWLLSLSYWDAWFCSTYPVYSTRTSLQQPIVLFYPLNVIIMFICIIYLLCDWVKCVKLWVICCWITFVLCTF